MDLEGGGSILCPPNLGAHAEPFAGRAGRGVAGCCEGGGWRKSQLLQQCFHHSTRVWCLFKRHVSLCTDFCLQTREAEWINPEITSVCLRQRVFHLLKTEIVEEVQSFHIF